MQHRDDREVMDGHPIAKVNRNPLSINDLYNSIGAVTVTHICHAYWCTQHASGAHITYDIRNNPLFQLKPGRAGFFFIELRTKLARIESICNRYLFIVLAIEPLKLLITVVLTCSHAGPAIKNVASC